MMLAADNELHAGLVALLGAVVATSVFTIGLVTHRSQAALARARDVMRAPSESNAEHAHDTVAHAQSYLVLVGNGVLAVLAVAAAAVAGFVMDGLNGGDIVTLAGFCVLELTVIALGWHDHSRVRQALNKDLAKTGRQLGGMKTALAAEWRHRTPASEKTPGRDKKDGEMAAEESARDGTA